MRSNGRRPLAAAAVLLLAIAIAGATLVLTRDEDGAQVGVPTLTSADGLLKTAATTRDPIYWAGTRPGTRYELTRTRRHKSFVRYLPDGVDAGDERPGFLTVATYPQSRAYTVAAKSSRRAEMARAATPSGGLATWSRRRPNHVYLAYPGTDQLIEVFSPRGGDARRLVLAGEIGAVGEVSATEPAPRPLQAPSDLSR